jgi:hypothetical protein
MNARIVSALVLTTGIAMGLAGGDRSVVGQRIGVRRGRYDTGEARQWSP